MADDQKLICQSGAHGVGPTIFPEELLPYYDSANNICKEPDTPVIPPSYVDDWCPMSIPPELPPADQMMAELCAQYPDTGVCKQGFRQTWGSQASTGLDSKPKIAVIFMGKVHIYPTDDWIDNGPQWKENLTIEGDHLIRRIESSKFHVEDWEKLNSGVMGTIVGESSVGLAKFASLFGAPEVPPCPKPERFQAMMDTVKQHRNKLSSNNRAVYRDIFEAGEQFMLISEQHDKLRAKYELHREMVLGGAQGVVDVVLTPVETTAFTVLDMAAKVSAAGDPIREIAYRTTVSLIHAGAKGAGESLAGSRGKEIWMPVLQQLVTDLPGFVIDGAVGKWLEGDASGRVKTVVKVVVTVTVSLFVDMIVFVIWDYDQIKPESDREKKMEEWRDARIAKAVGDLIAGGIETLFNLPEQNAPAVRKKAQEVATNIAKTVTELWNKAREEHKADPHKAVWDIMLRELPETLGKAIATGVLNAALGQKFDAERETKKAELAEENKRIAAEQQHQAESEQRSHEEKQAVMKQQEAQKAAEDRAKAAKPIPLKAAAVEVATETEGGKPQVIGKPLKQDHHSQKDPPKRHTPPKKGEPVPKADTELKKNLWIVSREPNTRIIANERARKRDVEQAKAKAAFASKQVRQNARYKSYAKQRQ